MPLVGWNATLGARTPVVGTFHAYSTKAIPNHIATALGARRVFNRLSARIAVSEAAAWTGRRWFGGDYEIVPNGVDVDAAPSGPKPASEELRVLFVGRPEERKGLPVLLAAFGALVEHVPCRLTVIGAERDDVLRYLADPELMRWIDVDGRVSGEELWHAPARGRRALRALALGRELRHGPDRGLRRRHAGDRLRDRRLQRRRHRRRRRGPRSARRPPAPRRRAAARPPRARAPAGDGRGGAAQRPALRLAAGRRSGDGGLRAGDRGAPAAGHRRAGRALGRHTAAPTAGRAVARSGCPRSIPRRAGREADAVASRAVPGWAWPARSGSG